MSLSGICIALNLQEIGPAIGARTNPLAHERPILNVLEAHV